MRRIFKLLVWLIIFCFSLGMKAVMAADYEINNFESEINLEQDLTLLIREKIEVNYFIQKHGIYRVIPYVYTHNGKTIRAELKVLGVTDGQGNRINYKIQNYNQSKRIQIGDADKLVTGNKNYLIEYKISEVVLDYGEGPEIYWNVTGDEWEVPIKKTRAVINSPFGKIIKTECFGCENKFDTNEAIFEGKQGLSIVVQIDKSNNLIMPSDLKKASGLLIDNWGYLIALAPTLIMFIFWYKKGRDKKYLTDNVYYKPEDGAEKNVSLLSRPHLPLVYSPIDGLSPAEIGTINDERVDTKDIVAEIVELARLEYLIIKKIESKGIFGFKKVDYELTNTKKTTEHLNEFQVNLIDNLFNNKTTVNISDLKNHFYLHLKKLKSDLYKMLTEKKITEKNIDEIRAKWIGISSTLNAIGFGLIFMFFTKETYNIGPIFLISIGIFINLFLALKMPKKTAWGYSLNRQTEGLKYYLEKGKWREEIAEKKLFLEEMLPLAIALGVVNTLANDMKDLGVEPPKYFQGMVISSFANDLNHFSSAAASGLVTSPSGNSSWSGGSGFSGGGGGGFGGGGGGSW